LQAAHYLDERGQVLDTEVPVGSRQLVARVLRHLGRLQEARNVISSTADKMLAARNPRIASNALIQEGAILAQLNEPEAARSLLERAATIMSENSTRRAGALAETQSLLADLETSTGHPEVALRRLEAFLHGAGYIRHSADPILQPVLLSAGRAAL